MTTQDVMEEDDPQPDKAQLEVFIKYGLKKLLETDENRFTLSLVLSAQHSCYGRTDRRSFE